MNRLNPYFLSALPSRIQAIVGATPSRELTTLYIATGRRSYGVGKQRCRLGRAERSPTNVNRWASLHSAQPTKEARRQPTVGATPSRELTAFYIATGRRSYGVGKQRGFTLLEMLLVLLLMGLVASAGLMLTEGVEDQSKYDETKRRMELIRKAIIGDPTRTVNGAPEISGFVADMGRLPNDLRELLQIKYCYKDFPTESDCTTNGATWYEAEAYKNGVCSDPAYIDKADCEAVAETWTPNAAELSVGWRGPYLQVSPEHHGGLHIRDGYGNSGDNTETVSSDARNSGWDYQAIVNAISLTSRGFDTTSNADDVTDSSLVEGDDWKVDISAGINISLLKPYQAHPLVSQCSDPTKSKKADCTSPQTWFGGCDKAGYFNKSSCEAVVPPGNWIGCSDGISTDRASCGSNSWYGEGYGCTDQSKTTKADCTSPNIWRSCTDDGTITDKLACDSANEIWFGNSLYTVTQSSPHSYYLAKNICMIVFYRDVGSINWAKSDSQTIVEDGSQQIIRFST